MTSINDGRKIACVGGGLIGRGWAVAFASSGFEVSLYDRESSALESSIVSIRESAGELMQSGLIDSTDTMLARITATTDLADALGNTEYVQESVYEDLEVKRKVYSEIDALAENHTVVGSSVSGLPASEFMGGLGISSRCLVAHPTSPPFLTPLTEIYCTRWTSEDTLHKCETLMEEIGQITVRVKKEIDGYVLNRLQAAVVNEALHLVGEDVMSPEDIDKVMVYGLGMRWALSGPFLTGHLNADHGYREYMTKFGEHYKRWGKELKVNYDWDMDVIEKIHHSISGNEVDTTVAEAKRIRDRKLMKFRKVMIEH